MKKVGRLFHTDPTTARRLVEKQLREYHERAHAGR
jgi:hypothetical protein